VNRESVEEERKVIEREGMTNAISKQPKLSLSSPIDKFDFGLSLVWDSVGLSTQGIRRDLIWFIT
jgi:hypothetical protein